MPLTGTFTKSGETLTDVYAVIGTTASDGVNLTGNLDVYRSKASHDDKYAPAFRIRLRMDDDRSKLQVDLLEAYAVQLFPDLKTYVDSTDSTTVATSTAATTTTS